MNPDTQALLDAYAKAQGPSPRQLEATWTQLEARVAAGELGPPIDGSPPAVEASRIGLGLALKVGAGLLALGIVTLGKSHGGDEAAPSREARVPQAELSPAPLADEAPPTRPAGSLHEPALAVERPPASPSAPQGTQTRTGRDDAPPSLAKRALPRRRPALDTRASEPQADGLGPEMQLMSEARLAIGRGEPQRALELLDEHRRRFRRGVFTKEREVSRVTALCALGRNARAVQVAKAFIAVHPNSLLAARMRQSCAGPGLDEAQPSKGKKIDAGVHDSGDERP